ncbi:hypothetical protein LYZ83_07880, partial [Xanthomonas hortorum pv. vitians]|uniref:hypothetical protein n=1 Tax=Xanthomonas hortorum TaxID=56454 RepID=UPI001F348A3C
EDLPASLLALAQALSVTERQLHGSLLNMGVVSLICGALFRGSLTESNAIDTAVMRAEAAAGAEGYSQCVLKSYSTWKPQPTLPSWAASAVVDCRKSVSSVQP